MRLVRPPSSETCGRVDWKSKNSSASMSAKRSASQRRERYSAASDAPCAPSFQPRNAATRTGDSSSGSSVMRSASAITSVYGRNRPDRAPQQRHERDHRGPDRGRKRDVDQHEPPRQAGPVLDLADRHLRRENGEHDERRAEHAGPATALRVEVGEERRERAAEDGSRTHVQVDRRLERAEAAYRLASGMRPGGRDERPADDEREAGRDQHEADTSDNVGNERLGRTGKPQRLDRDDDPGAE